MRYQLQHPSYITPGPINYVCFGLGSCIGVFIADRTIALIGGMHNPFPTSLSDGEFLSIARLIELLLVNFRMARRNLNVLLATIDRVTQGYRSLLDIGKQNINMVIQKLTPKRNFGSVMKKHLPFSRFIVLINPHGLFVVGFYDVVLRMVDATKYKVRIWIQKFPERYELAGSYP